MKDGGLFIVISFGLVSTLFLSLVVTGGFDMPENSGGWIYEYQTLITGLVAAVTAAIIWYQHKEIIRRKGKRMRAGFPDALSNLVNYAHKCFLYIHNNSELPEKPEKDILVFKEAIEFLDKDTSDAIFEMVCFYQIFNSRLADYTLEQSQYKREQRILDLARLSFFITRMWDYARGREEKILRSKNISKDNHITGLTQAMRFHVSNLTAEEEQNYFSIIDRQI